MAEDEDMDLEDDDLDLGDDDLDLGDDSGDDDGGDDFAGELDDMMGDDELGGDDDAGGDDSELDSFFEDLSSIEDMDEGPSDDSDDSDDIAPPTMEAADEPEEKPQPATVKKERPEGKGSKLKLIVPLIILLLLGGGGGYYYMFMKDTPMSQEEMVTEVPTPKEVPIRVERLPEKKVELAPQLPPPPPPAAKPKPPQRQYLIQVATCSYDACKENYINSLRQDGEPVFQKTSSQKYDFIELISRQIFSYQEGDSIVKELNRKNKMAGNATLINQSNGYRISMGVFPALDRAKEIKFHVEKLIPKQQVLFNLEHVRKNYSTIKIFAGPYDSRIEAKKVLAELRKKSKYKGSFLLVF